MKSRLGSVCLLLILAIQPLAQTPPADKTGNDPISLVDNSLLLAVLIKGEPVSMMSLAERMKHYNLAACRDNPREALARIHRRSNAGIHVSEHERLPARRPHRRQEKSLRLHTSHHTCVTLRRRVEQRGTFARSI
jgi:hypothetical protein